MMVDTGLQATLLRDVTFLRRSG
ncbi:hypothetical protein AOLI_G00090420 [Acnodon oligacanthus]